MTARRFRKKPVVVEAVQWRVVNHEEIKAFLGPDYVAVLKKGSAKAGRLRIRTLEGTLDAAPGDWIIRGVQGEHYPCKPEIFEATYQELATGGAAVGHDNRSAITGRFVSDEYASKHPDTTVTETREPHLVTRADIFVTLASRGLVGDDATTALQSWAENPLGADGGRVHAILTDVAR